MPTAISPFAPWQRDRYLEAVRSEAHRVATASYGPFDADDIAQEVATKLFPRLDETMAKYPDPVVYARAVARNEGIDHLRRGNAQRGAGAKGKRPVKSGDAPHPETGESFLDNYDVEGPDVADLVADDIETRYRGVEIQLGVPARELQAFVLTCVEGRTDAEAGVIMGVTRETVNRWKNNGRRRLQEMLA